MRAYPATIRELVLTSADGQSIYVSALVFYEDLAFSEEAAVKYNKMFADEKEEELK